MCVLGTMLILSVSQFFFSFSLLFIHFEKHCGRANFDGIPFQRGLTSMVIALPPKHSNSRCFFFTFLQCTTEPISIFSHFQFAHISIGHNNGIRRARQRAAYRKKKYQTEVNYHFELPFQAGGRNDRMLLLFLCFRFNSKFTFR